MNKKTKSMTVVVTSIAALTLLSAFSHADSRQYTDTLAINTDIDEATSVVRTSVGGTLIEAELELENDRAIWEIEVVDEANQVISVEVDGATGEIIDTQRSDEVAPSLSNVITMEQAIELVQAVENGALVEVELEEEDGSLIWEIEMLDKHNQESEFRVDGVSGELIQ